MGPTHHLISEESKMAIINASNKCWIKLQFKLAQMLNETIAKVSKASNFNTIALIFEWYVWQKTMTVLYNTLHEIAVLGRIWKWDTAIKTGCVAAKGSIHLSSECLTC